MSWIYRPIPGNTSSIAYLGGKTGSEMIAGTHGSGVFFQGASGRPVTARPMDYPAATCAAHCRIVLAGAGWLRLPAWRCSITITGLCSRARTRDTRGQ